MIKLSRHIAEEMSSRGIELDWIEAALAAPDRVTADPTDVRLTRSFKSIAGFGGRVLRVVHRRQDDQIFIVTAHWDRGAPGDSHKL